MYTFDDIIRSKYKQKTQFENLEINNSLHWLEEGNKKMERSSDNELNGFEWRFLNQSHIRFCWTKLNWFFMSLISVQSLSKTMNVTSKRPNLLNLFICALIQIQRCLSSSRIDIRSKWFEVNYAPVYTETYNIKQTNLLTFRAYYIIKKKEKLAAQTFCSMKQNCLFIYFMSKFDDGWHQSMHLF